MRQVFVKIRDSTDSNSLEGSCLNYPRANKDLNQLEQIKKNNFLNDFLLKRNSIKYNISKPPGEAKWINDIIDE